MSFEKITITGGAGFLGRVLAKRLSARATVRIVDIGPPIEGFDYVRADMTDYAALRKAFEGQDVVIHLAAIANPRIASQEQTFVANVHGTWAVFQAAEDAGVRKVLATSSDAATGLLYNPADYMPQYLPVDEAHPLRPIEAYSLSKEVTESIARSYVHRGKLDAIIVRPTHILPPEQYPEIDQRGSDINNYHLWTYVAPEDVSQVFEKAMDLKDVRFDTFFASSFDGLNVEPTLELIEKRFGRLPEIRRPAIYRARPTASVIDTTRAREILGYEPVSDWRAMAASIEVKE